MNRILKKNRVMLLILGAGLTGMLCSCGVHRFEGKVVAVELQDEPGTLEGARLVLFNPDRDGNESTDILPDFASAASPSMSHEGRFLFFQGQKMKDDPWQIWVMDLKKGRVSQVTHVKENCTHPASLPDGNVVFSRESSVKGTRVLDLWKCKMDGCCMTQLTFTPSENTLPHVLWEGRILYSYTQVYPVEKEPRLMIMRPDGTKSELYSPGCCETWPQSGGTGSPDGHIYFIGTGGRLCRVLNRRPLHTFENLSGDGEGRFASVTPLQDSTCLVSYLPPDGDLYGIYRLDPVTGEEPELLFSAGHSLVDPILVSSVDPRPRILPSPVNPENPTAELMIQNINHSMLTAHPGLAGDSLADRIRISPMDGEPAVVESKKDGSVYLKMNSDTPFRIETLNTRGEVVRGPSGWIYLRPGERRACTGCHADPELAPRNLQPLAVKEGPVVLVSETTESSH